MIPYWLMHQRQPSPETLLMASLCMCPCHPSALNRPKAVQDRRCAECWEEGGQPWDQVLDEIGANR